MNLLNNHKYSTQPATAKATCIFFNMTMSKREYLNLSFLFLSALDGFQKTGSIRYSKFTISSNDNFRLSISDDHYSIGDTSSLVPITVMPKKDGKIEIEWNPMELIEIQRVDGFSYPKESLQANIDKHAVLRTDEVNVGIIARNKLSEIIIIGGYQISILIWIQCRNSTDLYNSSTFFYSDHDEVIGCGSPRVNADLTSIPKVL